MKKGVIIFIIGIIISSSTIYSEKLIQTDTLPNKSFKKIESLALYKFDGKLINSGRLSFVDTLSISDKFSHYLLKKFQEIPGFTIVEVGEKITISEGDNLSVIRGKNVPQYDSKTFINSDEKSENVVKTIESSLYGKITKYYEGETFDTSYIEITFYLVNTKSKVIYWVTQMSGCLKYVVDTIVQTIATGEYSEPTVKDRANFKWKNPYELRTKEFAIEYRRGYMLPADKLDSGANNILALYFKLPLFNKLPIYNQIEINIIPSLKSTDTSNPLMNYQYTTYVPLFFDFIYNFDTIIKINNLRPFARLGLGGTFISTYYSGTGYYIPTENRFDGILNFGIGVEYSIKIGLVNIWKLYFRLKKIGFVGYIDYYKWFSSNPTSGSLNLSLGLKYYF